MRLPQSFLQQLKDKCEIEDIISPYVQLRRRGGSLVGLCPFHSEKTPSFTVFPATQSYFCFGCGAGGDVVSFIRGVEHLDYIDAVKYLADKAGVEMPEEDEREKPEVGRDRLYAVNKETARYFHNCLLSQDGEHALGYFKKRGMSDQAIRRFGLGYAPDGWDGLIKHLYALGFKREELLAARVASVGKTGSMYCYFRNRAMFPIIDVRGQVIAFGGRVMDDSQPKYLNSPDTYVFKKSNNLFALNFAKSGSTEAIILAEGYMDVIALHQAGFTSAVATLGTAITEQQARLISRYAKTAVIAYDSDAAGKKATQRAIGLLNTVGVDVKVLSLPGAKDPDEYIKKNGADRFRLLLQKSDNYIDFQLERLKSQYNLELAEERVKYLDEAVRVLMEIQNPIEREVFAGTVAKDQGVSKEVLLNDIARKLKQKTKKEEKKLIGLQQAVPRERNRVNPEKSAYPRAARAEEQLLCILFFHPDYLEFVRKELSPEEFVTSFNRRLYETFIEILDGGQPLDTMQLGTCFSVQEMGYIAEILTKMDLMTGTKEEAFDYILVIREARGTLSKETLAEAEPDALQEYIRKLGNKSKGGK